MFRNIYNIIIRYQFQYNSKRLKAIIFMIILKIIFIFIVLIVNRNHSNQR